MGGPESPVDPPASESWMGASEGKWIVGKEAPSGSRRWHHGFTAAAGHGRQVEVSSLLSGAELGSELACVLNRQIMMMPARNLEQGS
jgi:hypothetical protein